MGAVTETGTGLSEMPGTFCSPALGVSSVGRADPGVAQPQGNLRSSSPKVCSSWCLPNMM